MGNIHLQRTQRVHILNALFNIYSVAEPYTPSATRPPATAGDCSDGLDCNLIPSKSPGSSMLWVVGPVVAGIGLALLVVLFIVFRRRRQPLKQPMDGGQVTTPLMSGFDMANASIIAPSDPVELRRMNFQTPGMLSHPPISVNQLSSHIEELKDDGASKFTAEYESIEPGQQFTWDNSSMDINKPKNR